MRAKCLTTFLNANSAHMVDMVGNRVFLLSGHVFQHSRPPATPKQQLGTLPVTCLVSVPRKRAPHRAPYCAPCRAPCSALFSPCISEANHFLAVRPATVPNNFALQARTKTSKFAGTFTGHACRARFRPCFLTCAPNSTKPPPWCKVPDCWALITAAMSRSGAPQFGFVLHSFI